MVTEAPRFDVERLDTCPVLELDQISIARLCAQKAWERETSVDPDYWAPSNPAWGQCVVTSLFLYLNLSSRISRSLVNSMVLLPDGRRVSHLAVELTDFNTIQDWTCQQFPDGSVLTPYKRLQGDKYCVNVIGTNIGEQQSFKLGRFSQRFTQVWQNLTK